MTPDDIAARIAAIEALRRPGKGWDDESAHAREDQLHQDVLKAIADGTCDDPAACARAALRTQEMSFARWCA